MGQGAHLHKVSVHGGHSGQFCQHARDSLEQVIQAYIAQGFSWVGITEHMPPPSDARRYPDEVQAGLDASYMQRRFADYFEQCRALRDKYRDDIEIMVAFETETYDGGQDNEWVETLISQLRPDYLVGSLHHVHGTGIDFSKELYEKAIAECGGIEALYCEYFDAQYAMLQGLRPAVVGHFDLIRIFDPGYRERLAHPRVAQRLQRNLECIRREDLILDFNLRGFHKGEEAYPAHSILRTALDMGIAVVPGDDSHGVDSVGKHYEHGVRILADLGADLNWRKPRLLQYDSH